MKHKIVSLVGLFLPLVLLSSPAQADREGRGGASAPVLGLRLTLGFSTTQMPRVELTPMLRGMEYSDGLTFPRHYTLSGWNEQDYQHWLDSLRSLETQNRFHLNVAAAAGLLTGITVREAYLSIRHRRKFNFKSLLRDGSLWGASGFLLAAPFSPGPANLEMSYTLFEGLLRWSSIRILYGAEEAGDLRANLAVALAYAVGRSLIPADIDRYLPCRGEQVGDDFCNGFYDVAMRGFLNHASQEILSRVLDDAVHGRLGARKDCDGDSCPGFLAAGLRGGAFGTVERGLLNVLLGPPRFVSEDFQLRMMEKFQQAGLSKESQSCLANNIYRGPGLLFLFPGSMSAYSWGKTTIARKVFFTDEPGVDRLFAHEIGGHCTQALSAGVGMRFLLYMAEGLQHRFRGFYRFTNGRCTGLSTECQAMALERFFVLQN